MIRCPKCRSEALSFWAVGVVEYDGGEWVFQHEFTGRQWLTCADCGHAWITRRDRYQVEQALAAR